jgi:flagellar basal-body rod modification protein FlgD
VAIDLIGGVAGTQTSGVSQAALGQDDFIKILLTQLTYQDPMKPLDNQEFIAQMAQFSALEQSRQLNEKIDALLNAQAASQSFGLLGKTVAYAGNVGGGGISPDWKVTQVSFRDGQPLLTLTHNINTKNIVTDVLLSQITMVAP